MITDYVLAAACFVLAAQLRRRVRSGPAAMWTLTLIATGAAAFLGGTYHGLWNTVTSLPGRIVWSATLLSIGVAGFGLGLGAAASELAPRAVQLVKTLLVVKLLSYAVIIVVNPLFGIAVLDYASVGLAVAVLAAVSFKRRRRPTAKWLLAAIAISAVAVLFLLVPFGRPGYGDERDVYHIVQIAAMVALYRAGLAAAGS